MIYAQTSSECCDQKSTTEDCCTTEKNNSCHSDNSNTKPEKSNCGDDCNQCNSCTVHFVMNYISPELTTSLQQHFFIKELNFEYGNSYFSSNIQNIWQPPKIG